MRNGVWATGSRPGGNSRSPAEKRPLLGTSGRPTRGKSGLLLPECLTCCRLGPCSSDVVAVNVNCLPSSTGSRSLECPMPHNEDTQAWDDWMELDELQSLLAGLVSRQLEGASPPTAAEISQVRVLLAG